MKLTLEIAIEVFADWRKNKKSKAEAMPELLTKMVKDLHPIYGTIHDESPTKNFRLLSFMGWSSNICSYKKFYFNSQKTRLGYF